MKLDGTAPVKLISAAGRTKVIDASDSLCRRRWVPFVNGLPGQCDIDRWAKFCFAACVGCVRSRSSRYTRYHVWSAETLDTTRTRPGVTTSRLHDSVSLTKDELGLHSISTISTSAAYGGISPTYLSFLLRGSVAGVTERSCIVFQSDVHGTGGSANVLLTCS